MISADNNVETVVASLRAGAMGYLPKTASLMRLPEALHGVMRGEAAIPRDLTARVLALLGPGGRSHRHPLLGRLGVSLTSREADVLDLLRQGWGTAEISGRLFLSATTVRSHVSALLRKFGVRDRQALLDLLDPE
jgi:DNA-binding NarL/FixJ family response regulator